MGRVGIERWQASSSGTDTSQLSYVIAEEPGDIIDGLGMLDEDVLGSERVCLRRLQTLVWVSSIREIA